LINRVLYEKTPRGVEAPRGSPPTMQMNMTNLTQFDKTIAQQLLDSSESFPVDFNVAWEWLGYARKDLAKRNFLSYDFVKGIDYEVFHVSEENSNGGRPTESIILSVDCFKMWAMMSKTEQGKLVRVYFLECEKVAKQAQNNLSPAQILLKQAEFLVKIEQEQERIKLEQQLQSQKMTELETLTHQHDSEIDRIFNSNGHYLTIMGYYNNHKLGAVPIAKAAAIGKKVAAYCRANNILITSMKDPRFGMVNSYPEDVIALFVGTNTNPKEYDNVQIDPTPSIVDSESLQEIWQKVLKYLEPLTTRELLTNQCKLIEFDGVNALVGVSSANILKLIAGKLTNLQGAFAVACQKYINVTLDVMERV
jgi:phage anti-repressor protein